MFRFKDAFLPFNVTLYNSLRKIYGVGRQRALYISALFGFSSYYSINLLNYYYFECIVASLKR